MLRLKQISKSFPGVQALSHVDFEVEAGEIHALVGENGAGKSTLTKIIAGAYQPDAGHIELEGAAVRWDSPGDAKLRGIHVIYQELILFPELSVAENIFIGNERRRASGAIEWARSRPTIMEIRRSRVTAAVACVPISAPSFSTVTRSESSNTSSRRCEI